ncbi:MAG: GNAT family N-acetyltransferase [Micromonosporaceae bacterium]
MTPAAIGQLERVAALGWRAPEERWLGEWLLRAARGFTGRANSALAIGDPGRPHDEAVGAVRRWYRARGLPPMITVCYPLDGPAPGAGPGAGGLDAFLAGAGWHVRAGRTIVMTAAAADVPRWHPGQGGMAVEFSEEPHDDWLSLYHHGGKPPPPIARRLLVSAPSQVFATIREGRTPVAIGRLALADGWGGLTAIEVHPGHRRRGLGTLITAALTSAASARGVTRMYLQVEDDNTAAMRLYARCGFTSHHRYHYRVAPPQGS